MEIYEKLFHFTVAGNRALFIPKFNRNGDGSLETSVVPSYWAIKGICDSIYWRPTIQWVVDRIRVLAPIVTETKNSYTYLVNPSYEVEAHMIWNEARPDMAQDRVAEKHISMAARALKKGGRMSVYLGNKLDACAATTVASCHYGQAHSFYAAIPSMSFGSVFHSLSYDIGASKPSYANYHDCEMRFGEIVFPLPENCQTRIPMTAAAGEKESA